jgi:hypothetical protein
VPGVGNRNDPDCEPNRHQGGTNHQTGFHMIDSLWKFATKQMHAVQC